MSISEDTRGGRSAVLLIDQLEAVAAMSDAVGSAADVDDIYRAGLDALLQALPVDRASILVFDDDEVMRFKAWANLSADYRRAVEGHTPWKRGQRGAEPVLVADVLDDAALAPWRDVIVGEGIRALAFVPLESRDGVLGKFMLYADAPHAFTAEEVRLATIIARHIAFALERRRAEQALRDSERALERAVRRRTEELEAARRLTSEFVSVVAHDLRAPLRAISGYIEALVEECDGQLGERPRAYASSVLAATGRMDRLILDLLSYVRMERTQVTLARVALAEVALQTRVRLRAPIEARAAEVRIEIGPDDAALAHEETLAQALHHLMLNALRFVAPDRRPEVTVRCEPRGTRIRVVVEDNGPGIAPEHHERIFRAFEQLGSEGRPAGTGLGLALVRRAAQRMGGEAGVHSEPGRGSRFWIEVAAADFGTR
ncbi:MAG TPA: GAF domain-containing sensor histidine kinase [Candidatus Eisenbacteria bacterium]|nr:GAF domain-containing sensor histidine kinase [Candidatus Eisenbacteria bacterium]